MSEQGIRDFLTAKRKAAERFGVTDGAVLPKNTEIEDALAEYQRLFGGARHGETLAAQRSAALSAMQMLADFEPRLVGSVLAGTATEHNDIQLHLFADRAEAITIRLMDFGIEHEVVERRVRFGADRVVAYPGVHFEGLGLLTNHPFDLAYEAAENFTKALQQRTKAAGFMKSLLLQRICSSFASKSAILA